MSRYRRCLRGGAMGLCRGEGSVIHPREKGGYPSGGLADDLQELGVVLIASQILNVEPVDDRQDAAATTREELEHAIARVAEHEAVVPSEPAKTDTMIIIVGSL